MQELLHPDLPFRLNGRLWIEGPTERFMGIGRLELLEKIDRLGSISRAAQEMQMSYKRAWDLVTSMNQQAREPLVSTQAGGKQGGGAVVTEAGQQMIREFTALQARFQAFLAEESRHLAQ
ncbi:LysR family transcriptional regulator [Hymenobacter sp. BT635]|uniref:LysR family transcriptional regulator n=1 Tax=Hymenobacter nitidus TaxID=2880929 RepID=A0ABS8A9V1_9BACT|nr:LysR family transcriptional regulator [Hymenobacter nitidus]MCB2377171.1 LysR family transcriptional regulator [Hymenobacter nitidus]